MEDKARLTALHILNRFDDQRVTLDKLIDDTLSKNDSLSAKTGKAFCAHF